MKLTNLMKILVAGLVAGGLSQVNAAGNHIPGTTSSHSNAAKMAIKQKAKSNVKHHAASKMFIKNKARNTVKSNEKKKIIKTKMTHKLVR